MSHVTLPYNKQVDGLRAIAVILVVMYHVGLSLVSGGVVGVDIFFVISGYLISALLLKEAHKTQSIDFKAFYARRVRRLMPLLMFVLASTLLAGYFLLLPNGEQQDLGKSALAAALFVSNFYFFDKTGGYFDSGAETHPLLHTWSLAVEEQFYLFWPILILVAIKVALKYQKDLRLAVTIAVGVVSLISFVFCLFTPNFSSLAFYMMPFRIWEFGIGALIAFWGSRHQINNPQVSMTLAIVGLLMVIYSGVSFDHFTVFPGIAAAIPCIGAGLLVLSSIGDTNHPIARLLGSTPMISVGQVSYGFYLWHWPLISIYSINVVGATDQNIMIALGFLSLLLSYITKRLIENPFRYRRVAGFRSTGGTLLSGGALLTSLCAVAVAFGLFASYKLKDDPSMAIASDARKRTHLQNACHHDHPYSNLPELESCVKTKATTKESSKKPQARILLWGDSHARHYSPMLEKFVEDTGANVGFLHRTHNACPPLIGEQSAWLDQRKQSCEQFNTDVFSEIRGKQVNGVFLSGRWLSHFAAPFNSIRSTRSVEKKKRHFDLVARTELNLDNLKSTLDELQICFIQLEVPVGLC